MSGFCLSRAHVYLVRPILFGRIQFPTVLSFSLFPISSLPLSWGLLGRVSSRRVSRRFPVVWCGYFIRYCIVGDRHKCIRCCRGVYAILEKLRVFYHTKESKKGRSKRQGTPLIHLELEPWSAARRTNGCIWRHPSILVKKGCIDATVFVPEL